MYSLRRDTKKVRAQNASNTIAPAPETSETPTSSGGLNSFSYPNIDDILYRVHKVIPVFVFLPPLVVSLALGCSNTHPESIDNVVITMTATPTRTPEATRTPKPRNTPIPTATPGTCILAEVVARRDESNPCTIRNPCAYCHTPTPEPSDIAYCEQAAENIELMTSGKHPTLKNVFGVYIHIKFSEVRPTMEPEKCFGLATTRGSDFPERLTFSYSEFRYWDRWQDGHWE